MFLERVDRPDVDRIENIRPAVALEQKNPVRTARSTVGTATEIYDYLRLLYAKIGRVHCPRCGARRGAHSAERIVDRCCAEHAGARALVIFRLPCPPGAPPPSSGQPGPPRVRAARRRTRGRSRRSRRPSTGRRAEVEVVLDRVVLEPRRRAPAHGIGRGACARAAGGSRCNRGRAAPIALRRGLPLSACGSPLERPQPMLFSFNHPLGACAECKGFGNVLTYDEALVVPDPPHARRRRRGAVDVSVGQWYQRELLKAAKRAGVDLDTPWEALPRGQREFVYDGRRKFPGIRGFFEEVESYRYKLHVRVFLSRYRSQSRCPRVRGRAAEAGGAGGARGRAHHRGVQRAHDRGGGPPSIADLKLTGVGGRGRARDPEAAQRQAHVPAARGPRLPHARPADAHAVRRRSAAHQPREPARLAARGHALRPRRAVDRPARA